MEQSYVIRNDRVIGKTVPNINYNYSTCPIGSIFAFSSERIPLGFFICDGASYKVAEYPDLYAVIGNTYGGDTDNFNVPDYRETVLVGVGENTTDTIASHDVYELGEFKDDQLQTHTHTETHLNTGDTWGWAGSSFRIDPTLTKQTSNPNNARTGTTTHGKQKGVTYIIKAFHTNEGVDSGVSDDVVEYVDNKVDGLISDTSSTTSTYSSAKIDEKINDTAKLVYFSRAANRGYLKITNADDGRPISISDVCGGKIEIYGSGRVVASDNYYFAKVLRLSYGNWTTFDATKDTVIHKKIFKTYLDETNKTFYVEVSTHARFCVEGAKTVEMLELDDVDIAQFTEIPESAFASISDSSTSETSTWSSSKIANEINPTIDRTDLFPSNELDLNLLYNRCGTGVYDIVGQGTAGHGMIRADLWAINNGTICYIVSIMYSDGSSSTVGGNINAQPTVPINSKWMSVINKLTKIGYL